MLHYVCLCSAAAIFRDSLLNAAATSSLCVRYVIDWGVPGCVDVDLQLWALLLLLVFYYFVVAAVGL